MHTALTLMTWVKKIKLKWLVAGDFVAPDKVPYDLK